MSSANKNKSISAVIASLLLYFLFAYDLDRTSFYKLFFLYIGLFGIFMFIIRNEKNNFPFLIGISILFRLVFLFAIPNLSQDFYRFIWDGRMMLEGLNPYLYLPQTFAENQSFPVYQGIDLYEGMGSLSASHYTNYPPLNQLNFFLAALFSNTNILGGAIILRLQIILADIGILYFGTKVLDLLKIPRWNLFLYALNPFIIIELTGNLHFEAVMLFFLIWSIYLLLTKRWILAALILGFSVSVKLIPLLFLPLFFQWFKKQQKANGIVHLLFFITIVIATNIVLFLPFLSENLLNNYMNSVGLWFQNFEFNASIYYIVREIGITITGYNQIAIIGKILPVIAILFLAITTFFRDNKSPQQLITALLFGLTFYYFTATTMHPWYLATLVLLSVFTRYRFAIVWSLVIILSYQAYANSPWKENLWLVAIEYFVVFTFLFWEVYRHKTKKSTLF